ncbi:hypothetical protein D5086_016289 [Populus alba]|uniref:Uncharacterized protein n=1 Tax=Populus alba TaxID=43335 RepID=A0ACC4BU51_POPAL
MKLSRCKLKTANPFRMLTSLDTCQKRRLLFSSSNVDKITSARDLLSMDPVPVDQAHLIICLLTSTAPAAAAAAAAVRGLSFLSLSNICVYIYILVL